MPGFEGHPLSPKEMAVVEQNAVALGLTIDALMENAGRVVAEESAKRLPPPPARVGVVAGIGNNGGDGMCAAFYLHQWGFVPEIWLLRPPSEIRSRAAQRCYERIARLAPIHSGVPQGVALRPLPIVLDAMLGTGQLGELRPPFSDAAAAIAASQAPVLSVDVPSGLGATNAVRPRWTVTLTVRKDGMTNDRCGEIIERDIGIPWEAYHRTGPGEFLFFPRPESTSIRGRSARLLIVGGGPYAGAPALAGLAALRAGAERATVVAPDPAAMSVQHFSPNLVVHAVGDVAFDPKDVPALVAFFQKAEPRAVVLGMGSGAAPRTIEAYRELISELRGKVPIVVDAEALQALEPPPTGSPKFDAGNLIATPNEGEFQRVFGPVPEGSVDERLQGARTKSAQWGVTLLVKGYADLISDGERSFVNLHHHPANTVSGVGDVLAGVVGSLLAQGATSLEAARLATYWVGEAGVHAAAERSFGLIATDVIDELPRSLLLGLQRAYGTN